MPLYMDIHKFGEISIEDVKKAHMGGEYPDGSHGWMSDGVGKILKPHCRSFVTVFVRNRLDSIVLN